MKTIEQEKKSQLRISLTRESRVKETRDSLRFTLDVQCEIDGAITEQVNEAR